MKAISGDQGAGDGKTGSAPTGKHRGRRAVTSFWAPSACPARRQVLARSSASSILAMLGSPPGSPRALTPPGSTCTSSPPTLPIAPGARRASAPWLGRQSLITQADRCLRVIPLALAPSSVPALHVALVRDRAVMGVVGLSPAAPLDDLYRLFPCHLAPPSNSLDESGSST
jgi:hypothetical protein